MKMQVRTSPQLVLAGELLRASGADLENRVHQEIRDNPALELNHEQAYMGNSPSKVIQLQTGTRSRERRSPIEYDSGLPTFEDQLEKLAHREPVIDQLIAQAALLVNRADLETVTAMLYAIDSDGYLRVSSEDLSTQLGLEQVEIERLIPILHELEPPGIGARDLRECLLIQCRYLQTNGVHCGVVKRVLEEAWDDFTAQHWDRIAKRLRIRRTELEGTIHFISQNLNPHPLALIDHEPEASTRLHQPDLIISPKENENDFSLEIPAAAAFDLHISDGFTQLFRELSPVGEELSSQDRIWIQGHLSRARLFILSLQKRWETLRRIGEYLIQFQHAFLKNGPSNLKPLTQAMVAHALNCHESTVSRAVQNKVVQLPTGRLVAMEVFFDASLPIKAAIKQMMAESHKSMSDREMSERLAQVGYSVARRTITKYRAQLSHTTGL
jgi:RNA polymerase sigma-54 factor